MDDDFECGYSATDRRLRLRASSYRETGADEDHPYRCACSDECVCVERDDAEECPDCEGTGMVDEENYCPRCDGGCVVCWCEEECRCRERPSLT